MVVYWLAWGGGGAGTRGINKSNATAVKECLFDDTERRDTYLAAH